MNLAEIIPVLELLIPTLKDIVTKNVPNAVEKAALVGFLDFAKTVADAYVSSQVVPPVPAAV